MGLVLIMAAVPLLAELAVEGLQGLAGGGGGCWGECLVSLLGFGGQLMEFKGAKRDPGVNLGVLTGGISTRILAAVSSYSRAGCLLIVSLGASNVVDFRDRCTEGRDAMQSWWSSAGRMVECWDPARKRVRVPSRV